jgi:hypothetical protein
LECCWSPGSRSSCSDYICHFVIVGIRRVARLRALADARVALARKMTAKKMRSVRLSPNLCRVSPSIANPFSLITPSIEAFARAVQRDCRRRKMEMTMLTALVLICSITVTPDLADCSRHNATAVMRVPAEFGNPATCFMHGQAYLANNAIGQEMAETERVKLVCARSGTVDAMVRRLTAR